MHFFHMLIQLIVYYLWLNLPYLISISQIATIVTSIHDNPKQPLRFFPRLTPLSRNNLNLILVDHRSQLINQMQP